MVQGCWSRLVLTTMVEIWPQLSPHLLIHRASLKPADNSRCTEARATYESLSIPIGDPSVHHWTCALAPYIFRPQLIVWLWLLMVALMARLRRGSCHQ